MNWDKNKGLFIMINDKGSICPIYKSVNELPQDLRFFYEKYKISLGTLRDYSEMDQIEIIKKIFELAVPDIENPLHFRG